MSLIPDIDWKYHQEAIAQLLSWMAGGIVGGTLLALMSSSIEVFSVPFLIFFGLISLVGYYMAYIHVQVKPSDDIESCLENIESEVSELRSELSDSDPEVSAEYPETEDEEEEEDLVTEINN